MSGDVRSLIQAAQGAEGRGDPDEAASLLRRAAGLCEDGGRPARAAQLLRHAVRLVPEPAAIAWLESLEARLVADAPPVRAQAAVHALGSDDASDGLAEALAAFAEDRGDAIDHAGAMTDPPAPRRVLEPRGPALTADAHAWCSFCCRPSGETGALIESPTGAFVCASCLQEGMRLLGLTPGNGAASAGAPAGGTAHGIAAGAVGDSSAGEPGGTARRITGSLPWEHVRARTPAEAPRAAPRTPPGEHPRITPTGLRPAVQEARGDDELLLAHHLESLNAVEDALAAGHRAVLLLGPHGSGRSTCLHALIPRLGAEEVLPPFDREPSVDLWLLDDAQLLTPTEWRALSRRLQFRPEARLVLTAPLGSVPRTPALEVRTSEGQNVGVLSTSQLLEAAPGLPEGLAARVTRVVQVSHPEEAELTSLATAQLHRLRPDVEDGPGLAGKLARLAMVSGRGLHELLALIQRLPEDVVGAMSPATRGKTVAPKAAKTKAAATKSKAATALTIGRGLRKGRR